MKVYESRPSASRRTARWAWDKFQRAHQGNGVVRMHFARWRPGDNAWCAQLADGEWDEIDALTALEAVQRNEDKGDGDG